MIKNKAALYLTIFFLGFIALTFYSSFIEHNGEFYFNRGMKIVHQSRIEMVEKCEPGSVFMIKRPEEGTNLYRIKRKTNDGKYDIQKYYLGEMTYMVSSFLMLGFSEEVNFQTVESVSKYELSELIMTAEEFSGASKLEYENKKGLFEFLDDSIYIFILIAILILLLMLILEIPIWILNKLTKHGRLIVYLLGCLFTIYFISNFVHPEVLLPAIEAINQMYFNWGRGFVMILPLFLFYQWVNKNHLYKLEKPDEYAAKFVIILVGTILLSFVFSIISRSLIFHESDLIEIYPSYFSWAIGFAFALGNLLFVVAKEAWLNRGNKQKLDRAQKHALQKDSELNALQSSVNPHFLYNALNSIAQLAHKDPDRTKSMTLALSEFYKYNTNREQNLWSTIGEEVEMIKSYLEIEKIRFEDRLEFSLNFNPSLANEKIPHFLVQPLIENAIKYGYEKETDKIKIALDIEMNEKGVLISVSDGGENFDEDMQKGFGLKSVSQKLKLLYEEKHTLEFHNQPNKKVLITLEH